VNFIHPEFLYLLFLIPILIAINLFLKGKSILPVTTLFIWEKFHDDLKSKSITFNRLKKDISLLLQILFVILSTITLSQPAFFENNKEADNVAFIIDSSISMNAGVEGKQHISLAKKKAIQLLKGDYKTNHVMIIKAASDPEVVHQYSLDTNQLINAVRNISATDTIANLNQAIIMAFSQKEVPSKIIVLTSKLIDHIDSDLDESDIISWVTVGNILDNNVRISNLDIRQDFSINRSYQTFLQITNDSQQKQYFKLKVFHEEELYEVRDITMTPHESNVLLISLDKIREGLVRINMDVNDDLVQDNQVYILLEPVRELSVLLVTDGNSFLENVLTLHESVDIDLCKISKLEDKIKTGNYDVVIYDNIAKEFNILTNSILICSKENEYMDTEKGIVYPELLNFNYGHKSLKNLDLSNLSIDKSYILNVPDWGEALIESEHGALMFCGERDNKKLLVIGFDLMQSNFPLEIVFPVFISRMVSWFKDYNHKNWITAGESYYYKIPDSSVSNSVIVTIPDEGQFVYNVKNNLVAISDTFNAGVYKIEGDTFQKRFVVNFQTGNTTDNNVFSKNIIQQRESSIPGTTPKKLVFLFAILSLGALVLEWYFYVRA
jgi:hypothetical protein